MPVKNSVRTEGTRGDYGIRTLEGVTPTRLAVEPNRPLSHTSKERSSGIEPAAIRFAGELHHHQELG